MIRHFVVTALVGLLVAGCDTSDPSPSASSGAEPGGVIAPVRNGTPVVRVNGELVDQALLEAFATSRGATLESAEQREQLAQALASQVVAAQAALAAGSEQRATLDAELALARIEVLARAQFESWREAAGVDEAAARAHYESEVARAGAEEVHAAHLLFADEVAARAALDRARAPGADFDRLIAETTDAGTGTGQDLGFVNMTQLPPPIATLLATMADGEVADDVVQTRFGFHVIRRIEARPFSPPPFDQIRAGVEQQLAETAVREKLDAAVAAAKIEKLEAAGIKPTIEPAAESDTP